MRVDGLLDDLLIPMLAVELFFLYQCFMIFVQQLLEINMPHAIDGRNNMRSVLLVQTMGGRARASSES
jgi:hypothetical protein